jgi:hypothetical protein
MTLVLMYLAIAVLTGLAAYFAGSAGGTAFWLYAIGSALFALAALGQYFKVKQGDGKRK